MGSRKFSAAGVMAVAFVLVTAQITLGFHPIASKGSGGIKQSHGVDLDDGTFNGAGPNDIRLNVITPSQRDIVPEAGVTIKRMSSEPTFADCKAAALGTHSFQTSNNVGRWFCLRTDENRLGSFKIVSDTPGQKLPIRYVTWCKPSDSCVGP
jgi:hypothetical protein